MNTRILLLGAALVSLGSCSTIYKSGQTPDDVYYSPAPQQRVASNNDNDDDRYYDETGDGEYVNVQTDQDRNAYTSEDNYLRMKVRNRAMWSSLDYYDAMYSPYYGGSAFGYNSFYNPYSFYSPYSSFYSPFYSPYYGSGFGLGMGWGGLGFGYNSFYNPYSMYNPYWGGGWYGGYYPGGGISKPGYTRPAGSYAPRRDNLGTYGIRRGNTEGRVSGRNAPVRVFRNGNSNYVNPRSSSGSTSPRRSFDNGSSNSRPSRSFEPSNSAPTRSFSPSPSSGGRSGGGGGGSAPSRSPGRGGR